MATACENLRAAYDAALAELAELSLASSHSDQGRSESFSGDDIEKRIKLILSLAHRQGCQGFPPPENKPAFVLSRMRP